MFNFPKSLIGSPPGQEDQSARLAASAEVGQVEGTNFRDFFDILFRMPLFWACMSLNLSILVFFIGKELLPPSPFDVVEDWGDFFKFVFLWWTGNLPV